MGHHMQPALVVHPILEVKQVQFSPNRLATLALEPLNRLGLKLLLNLNLRVRTPLLLALPKVTLL